MAPQTALATSKIAARGASRTFGVGSRAVHALGPVDLEVAEGEFVSLVGPSGCGKSTLLRSIAGLVNCSRGEIQIGLGDAAMPIAMVFQDYSIYPWKTVAANVRFGLDLQGMPRSQSTPLVAKWLDRLGLNGFERAYPGQLSGGMRQRVAIARALVVEPEVLLMDEPFAALDAQLREILQEELLRIWEQERCTVLFVTHSLDEALVLSDRVVVMSARPGRIIYNERVPYGRPRGSDVRADPGFGQLKNELWQLLRSEVEPQQHAASQQQGEPQLRGGGA
ncbi:MAG: ABC transporter ATP-binding protein [Micromonosporaceae bacterium]